LAIEYSNILRVICTFFFIQNRAMLEQLKLSLPFQTIPT